MAFSFFGLKKKPVVHNVEPQTATPVDKFSSLTFDDALAAQVAAQALAGQAKALAAQVAAQSVATQAEPLAQAPMMPSAVVVEPLAAPLKATPEPEMPVPEISAPPEAPAFEGKAAPQEAEVLNQMETVKATREDVIAAYKIFLGRLPESMKVVDQRVGVSCAALLVDFLASKEFLDQPTKAQLMLAVAKKIFEKRQLATTATSSQSQPDTPSA
jgi:hypothetical protein